MKLYLVLILLILTSCGPPKEKEFIRYAYKDFKVEKYLGTWHEVMRIDNKFEKNLVKVEANYYIDNSGRLRVRNSGYDIKKNKKVSATGHLKKSNLKGVLRVSFFRPFWTDYIVLDIDSTYTYALVGGSSSDYLWILSRTGEIPMELKEKFIKKAKSYGYKTYLFKSYN